MRLKSPKEIEDETKMGLRPDSTTMPLGERQCNQIKVNRKTLNDIQKTRLFACICAARYHHEASDCDIYFDKTIYETTLELMQPHMSKLRLNDDSLPYRTVEKLWIDFIQTGLVLGKSKLKLETRGTNHNNREESLERNRKNETNSKNLISSTILVLVLGLALWLIGAKGRSISEVDSSKHIDVQRHLERIAKLKVDFPDLISTKDLRKVSVRTAKMQEGISILMLLGRHQDLECISDRTHCVAKRIANVTRTTDQSYIDAASRYLGPDKLTERLSDLFDDNRAIGRSRIVLLDNLSKLPGDIVMHLFQFIDKDEYNQRRGLLILVLYTDGDLDEPALDVAKIRDADVAERVLLQHWSPHIPSDTLTSVISRICGTIVRVQ